MILDAIGRQDEALATFEAGLKRCPESTILKAGLEPLRRERIRSTFKVIPGGLGRPRPPGAPAFFLTAKSAKSAKVASELRSGRRRPESSNQLV